MAKNNGFYSLIQYCPDRARLEAANVGVVVFSPERGYLKARVSSSNQRVRKFFGSNSDLEQIRLMRLAFAERFDIEAARIKTLAEFEHFANTRGNELQITAPRAMRVSDPDADLDRLFNDLVGGSKPKKDVSWRSGNVARTVATSIKEGGVEHFIEHGIDVDVQELGRTISVPFGFRNGNFNLIKPVDFPQTTEPGVYEQACKLAVEGRSISKIHDPKRGRLELVVVGGFSEPASAYEDVAARTLSVCDVRLYTLSSLGDLIDNIRKARPLPRK